MKMIKTHWAYLNYASGEPHDLTGMFSSDLDEGWEIQSISSSVDSYRGMPIVVVTALLSR